MKLFRFKSQIACTLKSPEQPYFWHKISHYNPLVLELYGKEDIKAPQFIVQVPCCLKYECHVSRTG